jgi:Tol biopolymer transport system component
MAAEPRSQQPHSTHQSRNAWIATGFGAWVVGGLALSVWADSQGLVSDVFASLYTIPFYLGILVLAVYSAWLAVRTVRRGDPWHRALPPGYGGLGAGVALILAGLVIDLGWRGGVGILSNIESGLAPSRVVIGIGLFLITFAPLRAALLYGADRVPRPAILASAALALAVLSLPGGFHPAANAWLERPPEASGGELWMMDADGSHQTRLIEGEKAYHVGYASWAPDGSTIGYARFHVPGDDFAEAEGAIWVLMTGGTRPTELLSGVGLFWLPRWSPDGQWLAFTREAKGGPWGAPAPVGPAPGGGVQGGGVLGPLTVPLPHADIWRVRADGSGSPLQLTDSESDDRAPVYSPDGSQILFDTTRDGNTEIYVMDADGSDERRLTHDDGEDWGASWSPDGSISFNSDRSGEMEIWVMAADGHGARRLTNDELADTAPSWSPDGSRIAYVRSDQFGVGQVWSMKADGSDQRNLSRSPSTPDQVWTGGWGPDGRIVFARGLPPLPSDSPIAREDLAAAAMLVSAIGTAAIVVLLVGTGPPFGSVSLVLALATAIVAVPSESWRFILLGLISGLAVDVAAWRSPPAWRARVVGGVAGGVFVLAAGAIVLATSRLAWTPTLLLGVALAAGAVGWGIGALWSGQDRERATLGSP